MVSATWQEEHFDTSWREAAIFPQHKKGSEATSDDYCPISLLSQTAKILTSIISQQIRAVSSSVNTKPVSTLEDRPFTKFLPRTRF